MTAESAVINFFGILEKMLAFLQRIFYYMITLFYFFIKSELFFFIYVQQEKLLLHFTIMCD